LGPYFKELETEAQLVGYVLAPTEPPRLGFPYRKRSQRKMPGVTSYPKPYSPSKMKHQLLCAV
jgi:hypothetical protein